MPKDAEGKGRAKLRAEARPIGGSGGGAVEKRQRKSKKSTSAPKGSVPGQALTASLKRCPDTNLDFFRSR
jgi:hypothetical protein